jgi:hypothetical protein
MKPNEIATALDYFTTTLAPYLRDDPEGAAAVLRDYGDELAAIPAYDDYNEAAAGSREIIDAWEVVLRHRYGRSTGYPSYEEALSECAEACAYLNR